MKTLIKLFFWTLSLCIILLIAVAVAIVTLDPNDHKDWIVEKVKEETGRDLALNGAIKLTWYPWLGLEVNDLTLGNAPGFGKEPFFHTDFAKFRVKLIPLFHKQYLVDTIQFHGTVINLAKNKSGVTNWSDLEGEKKQQQSFPLTSLIIGGVDIEDASLSWNDESTGTGTQLNKVNLKVGQLVYGQPIDLSLSLDLKSARPALSGDATLAGTIIYDQVNETVKVHPLDFNSHLRGKNIPGGKTEIALSTAVNVDLDKDIITIPEFSLNGLGTTARGNLEMQNIRSARPMIKTNLQVEGGDLSVLFKVAEIEPLASQIAGLTNRRFDLKAGIDVDLERGDVDVSQLSANLLDAAIRGNVKARNIQSRTPSFHGQLNASGPDLPTLLQVVGQFETGKKPVLGTYGKQLSNISKQQKKFEINSSFDADLKAGDIEVPDIDISGLGFTVKGKLMARNMDAKNGTVNGNLTITGNNLATVLAALDQQSIAEVLRDFNLQSTISGNRSNILLKPMSLKATFAGNRIPNSPTALTLDGDARIDLDAHQFTLDNFKATGLGLNLSGNVSAVNMQDVPRIKGDINATGDDLPVLLELAGRFQSQKDSALLDYGKRFGNLPRDYKKFRMAAKFDMDQKSGNLSLPQLSFNGLGLGVKGDMRSSNMQSPKGSINGNLDITGRDLGPVVSALDYQEIGGGLRDIHIETGVSGSRKNLDLKPLAVTATFLNKKLSSTPINMSLNANTNINLDSERLRLDQFSLNGAGLDAKGNITADKFLQSPEVKGALNIAPFNLRKFLASLDMEVPETADKQALTKVALSSRFSGSAKHIDVDDLKLVLDESTLQGKLSVTDFEKPATTFTISIDRINADRYQKPVPDNKRKKPVMPETAAAAAVQLPVETLRSLNTRGSLKIGDLIVSRIHMTNVNMVINGKNGDISIDPVSANLYQGKHTGDIKINAAGKVPRLTINTALKGIQLEPLLVDYQGKASMTGTANLSIAAIALGSDTDALKRTLNGQGEVHIHDGVLRGIDIRKTLEQVQIMMQDMAIHLLDQGKETVFDKCDLPLNIKNGIVRSDQAVMTSPGIRVTGEGVLANMPANNTINYTLNVAVDESTATRNEEHYNIGGYSLPIEVKGRLGDISYTAAFLGIVKSFIQKGLVNKIFQNKDSTGGQSQEQGTSGQQQTQQQPQQQVDPGKQILNKALEQILKGK